MAKAGILPSFCCGNTNSDSNTSVIPMIYKPDWKEPMEEEVSNKYGEYPEAEDAVTYMLLSGDEDFPNEKFSRIFFLVGANTKYGRAVRVNSRYITCKQ